MSDWIFNCVGGNLEDLDQVFSALKRGENYGSVLRRMITDSVSQVEDRLEQIMQQADALPPGVTLEDVYKRYMRFWKMMELLRNNDYVNRRDLIRVVFKEHTKELAEYVTIGIATYLNQKPVDEPPMPPEEPAADVNAPSEGGLSVVTLTSLVDARQPSIWERIRWYFGFSSHPIHPAVAKEEQKKAPQQTTPTATPAATDQGSATSSSATQPSAASAAATASSTLSEKAHPISDTSASPKEAPAVAGTPAGGSVATEKISGNSKEVEDARAYSTMLNASLDSVLVSAGSPRVRIAFDLLLKDPRIIEATQAVELHLKTKAVKDKLEKAEEKKKQVMFERSAFLAELNTLVEKAAAYKEELGQEVVDARLKRVLANETQVDQLLAVLDRQIQELVLEKVQLEASSKQVGRKL